MRLGQRNGLNYRCFRAHILSYTTSGMLSHVVWVSRAPPSTSLHSMLAGIMLQSQSTVVGVCDRLMSNAGCLVEGTC